MRYSERTMRCAVAVGTFCSMIALGGAPLQAQKAPPQSQDAGPTAAAEPQPDPALVEKLLERSWERPVRVIVEFDHKPALRAQTTGAGRNDPGAARAAALHSTRAAIMSRLEGTGVSAVKSLKTMPVMSMDVGPEALERLAEDPAVLSIREDSLSAPQLARSVPLIGAPPVHAGGDDGTGTAIAILDTGVDGAHPFFAGRIVAEACFSTTSPVQQSESNCPGGVGASAAVGSGGSCPAFITGCEHGTHVAGIAAGSGPDVTGVAPGAEIVAIQVFSAFSGTACTDVGLPSPCVLSYTSDQLAALEHVLELGQRLPIVAVNMSLGGGGFPAPCDDNLAKPVIDQLRAAGITTVISSGNDGFNGLVGAPGCISTAITVGSTTVGDQISDFSNYATLVDLVAPGSEILSSFPGGGLGVLSGTSMAAPHVAGALAVLASGAPGRTPDELEQALITTGRPVQGRGLARPRIQVDAALAALRSDDVVIGPGNDDFEDAIVLSGPIGNTTGTNVDADSQPGEPVHAGVGGGASVWWTWRAPLSGRARLDTVGSSFDTVLAVYVGSEVGRLSEVASNDDAPGVLQSAVEFRTRRGQTYSIAVDGFSGAEGTIALNFELEGRGEGSNDDFVQARVLRGRSGAVNGTNRGATAEFGEPVHAGVGGGKSVWWRWRAPVSGMVTFTTIGSNFDTVLAVYRGERVDRQREIASNDDGPGGLGLQSLVTFEARRRQVYRIAVDGFLGSEGDIRLSFSGISPELPTSSVAAR